MMNDESFIKLLQQAEAETLQKYMPWGAAVRELHGMFCKAMEELEARVAALEDAATAPAPVATADVKQCAHCGEVKSLAEFHRSVSAPDGHTRWCAACNRAYQHDRRVRAVAEVATAAAAQKRRAFKVNTTAEVLATGMKTCPHCGRTLPVADFNKSKRSADGVQSWCRKCSRKASMMSYRKAVDRRSAATQAVIATDLPTQNGHSVADYYGEVGRPVGAREFVVTAGVGCHEGRKK